MALASSSVPLSSGPLRSFAYRQFRLLWGASLFGLVSFMMVLIARGWLVLELTDSPFMVTAVNAVAMLPMMVFSAFGGVIADRLNRRKVLIVVEAFNFAIILTLALLLFTDLVQVWHIFVLSSLNGLAFALVMPARTSLVPNLVASRDIANAVALFTTIFSSSMLVGPSVAGYVIDRYDIGTTFLVASLLLIPAVALLLPLRIPRPNNGPRQATSGSVVSNVVEGLAYIRGQPLLVGLILLGLVATVLAMPYQTILPVYARDILDVGPDGLGLLAAAGGVGAIAGSFAVAFTSDPRQLRRLLFAGGMGMGLLITLFAISTVFLLSLALSVALGFMLQIFATTNIALMQVTCPDYIRGRVLGIRMIIMGFGPVGMLLLGVGAEVLSPAFTLGLMGLVGLSLTAIIGLAFPALRQEEAVVEVQAVAPIDD